MLTFRLSGIYSVGRSKHLEWFQLWKLKGKQIVSDSNDWVLGQKVGKIRCGKPIRHFSFVGSSNISLGGDEGSQSWGGINYGFINDSLFKKMKKPEVYFRKISEKRRVEF